MCQYGRFVIIAQWSNFFRNEIKIIDLGSINGNLEGFIPVGVTVQPFLEDD